MEGTSDLREMNRCCFSAPAGRERDACFKLLEYKLQEQTSQDGGASSDGGAADAATCNDVVAHPSWDDRYECCNSILFLRERYACVESLGPRPRPASAQSCRDLSDASYDEKKRCCQQLEAMSDEKYACMKALGTWTDPAAGCMTKVGAELLTCMKGADRTGVTSRTQELDGTERVEIDTDKGAQFTLGDLAGTTDKTSQKKLRVRVKVDSSSTQRVFKLVEDGEDRSDVEIEELQLECATCTKEEPLKFEIEAPVRVKQTMTIGANTKARFQSGAEIDGEATLEKDGELEIDGDVTGGGKVRNEGGCFVLGCDSDDCCKQVRERKEFEASGEGWKNEEEMERAAQDAEAMRTAESAKITVEVDIEATEGTVRFEKNIKSFKGTLTAKDGSVEFAPGADTKVEGHVRTDKKTTTKLNKGSKVKILPTGMTTEEKEAADATLQVEIEMEEAIERMTKRFGAVPEASTDLESELVTRGVDVSDLGQLPEEQKAEQMQVRLGKSLWQEEAAFSFVKTTDPDTFPAEEDVDTATPEHADGVRDALTNTSPDLFPETTVASYAPEKAAKILGAVVVAVNRVVEEGRVSRDVVRENVEAAVPAVRAAVTEITGQDASSMEPVAAFEKLAAEVKRVEEEEEAKCGNVMRGPMELEGELVASACLKAKKSVTIKKGGKFVAAGGSAEDSNIDFRAAPADDSPMEERVVKNEGTIVAEGGAEVRVDLFVSEGKVVADKDSKITIEPKPAVCALSKDGCRSTGPVVFKGGKDVEEETTEDAEETAVAKQEIQDVRRSRAVREKSDTMGLDVDAAVDGVLAKDDASRTIMETKLTEKGVDMIKPKGEPSGEAKPLADAEPEDVDAALGDLLIKYKQCGVSFDAPVADIRARTESLLGDDAVKLPSLDAQVQKQEADEVELCASVRRVQVGQQRVGVEQPEKVKPEVVEGMLPAEVLSAATTEVTDHKACEGRSGDAECNFVMDVKVLAKAFEKEEEETDARSGLVLDGGKLEAKKGSETVMTGKHTTRGAVEIESGAKLVVDAHSEVEVSRDPMSSREETRDQGITNRGTAQLKEGANLVTDHLDSKEGRIQGGKDSRLELKRPSVVVDSDDSDFKKNLSPEVASMASCRDGKCESHVVKGEPVFLRPIVDETEEDTTERVRNVMDGKALQEEESASRMAEVTRVAKCSGDCTDVLDEEGAVEADRLTGADLKRASERILDDADLLKGAMRPEAESDDDVLRQDMQRGLGEVERLAEITQDESFDLTVRQEEGDATLQRTALNAKCAAMGNRRLRRRAADTAQSNEPSATMQCLVRVAGQAKYERDFVGRMATAGRTLREVTEDEELSMAWERKGEAQRRAVEIYGKYEDVVQDKNRAAIMPATCHVCMKEDEVVRSDARMLIGVCALCEEETVRTTSTIAVDGDVVVEEGAALEVKGDVSVCRMEQEGMVTVSGGRLSMGACGGRPAPEENRDEGSVTEEVAPKKQAPVLALTGSVKDGKTKPATVSVGATMAEVDLMLGPGSRVDIRPGGKMPQRKTEAGKSLEDRMARVSDQTATEEEKEEPAGKPEFLRREEVSTMMLGKQALEEEGRESAVDALCARGDCSLSKDVSAPATKPAMQEEEAWWQGSVQCSMCNECARNEECARDQCTKRCSSTKMKDFEVCLTQCEAENAVTKCRAMDECRANPVGEGRVLSEQIAADVSDAEREVRATMALGQVRKMEGECRALLGLDTRKPLTDSRTFKARYPAASSDDEARDYPERLHKCAVESVVHAVLADDVERAEREPLTWTEGGQEKVEQPRQEPALPIQTPAGGVSALAELDTDTLIVIEALKESVINSIVRRTGTESEKTAVRVSMESEGVEQVEKRLYESVQTQKRREKRRVNQDLPEDTTTLVRPGAEMALTKGRDTVKGKVVISDDATVLIRPRPTEEANDPRPDLRAEEDKAATEGTDRVPPLPNNGERPLPIKPKNPEPRPAGTGEVSVRPEEEPLSVEEPEFEVGCCYLVKEDSPIGGATFDVIRPKDTNTERNPREWASLAAEDKETATENAGEETEEWEFLGMMPGDRCDVSGGVFMTQENCPRFDAGSVRSARGGEARRLSGRTAAALETEEEAREAARRPAPSTCGFASHEEHFDANVDAIAEAAKTVAHKRLHHMYFTDGSWDALYAAMADGDAMTVCEDVGDWRAAISVAKRACSACKFGDAADCVKHTAYPAREMIQKTCFHMASVLDNRKVELVEAGRPKDVVLDCACRTAGVCRGETDRCAGLLPEGVEDKSVNSATPGRSLQSGIEGDSTPMNYQEYTYQVQGMIKGNGTVDGDVHLLSGGVIMPAVSETCIEDGRLACDNGQDSVATLRINGNLAMQIDSRMTLQVSDVDADKVIVTGAADISNGNIELAVSDTDSVSLMGSGEAELLSAAGGITYGDAQAYDLDVQTSGAAITVESTVRDVVGVTELVVSHRALYETMTGQDHPDSTGSGSGSGSGIPGTDTGSGSGPSNGTCSSGNMSNGASLMEELIESQNDSAEALRALANLMIQHFGSEST